MKLNQTTLSKHTWSLMAGLLLGASSAQAVIALNLNSLTVFGDLDITSGDADGQVFVGGDLNGSATMVTDNSYATTNTTVWVGGGYLGEL
jgi:hypothetical protein